MGAKEITEALFKAVESGDMAAAGEYLSDNFEFSGPVPEPIGKEQWTGMQQTFLNAFQDWSFNISNIEEEGNIATTTHYVSGTHTRDLDLSAMNLPVVPSTGKTIKLPVEHAEVTVEGDKIVRIHVGDVSSEGGIPGIMKQLGVEMP